MNNREIKFRGKRIDNGEWAFGYVFYSIPDRPYIIQPSCGTIVTLLQIPAGLTVSPSRVHEVRPETVKTEVNDQWFTADELSDIVKKGLDK